jgi:hypothetical protein
MNKTLPRKSASKTAVSPYFRFCDNGSILEVKGIWLGAIEASGKQSTKTESFQVEGLNT